MHLSLVVCTRNRAPQLAATLDRLKSLRYPEPWELLIVDNGSTDTTQDVIASLMNDHPATVCPVTVSEPKAGLGRARNRGWNAASGRIIAFTDDDCYPSVDFLETVTRVFAENSALGFAGGRVLLFDPDDYPISIQPKADREDLSPGGFVSTGLIHGGNFAFRRSALETVYGFDERMGSGTRFACEDCDILARMLGEGWKGVYDPQLVVHHHHGRKTEAEAQKLRKEYIRGRGAYYTKCILNRKLSRVYARNWYWGIIQQPIKMTVREMIGGAEYLAHSLSMPRLRKRIASRFPFLRRQLDPLSPGSRRPA